jgi:hypothetical protein
MASMKSKAKPGKARFSESEIDALVEAQANIPSAWGNAVRVRRAKNKTLSLPADLAARAVFLAKLHREKNVESCLARIVKERVELEERAFTQAKCALSARVAP